MYSILCIVGLRSFMPLLNEDWLIAIYLKYPLSLF